MSNGGTQEFMENLKSFQDNLEPFQKLRMISRSYRNLMIEKKSIGNDKN